MDKLRLAQHLEVVCKLVYEMKPSISMTAPTEQHQHPKIGNQETAKTPEEAGLNSVDAGAHGEPGGGRRGEHGVG